MGEEQNGESRQDQHDAPFVVLLSEGMCTREEPHATDCTLRHVVLRLIGAFKENSREFKLDRFSKGLELLQKIQKRIQTREMSNAYFWINSNRLEQSAQDAAMQFAKEKENLKSSFMQNMSKQDNELEAFQNPMAIRCCVAPAC